MLENVLRAFDTFEVDGYSTALKLRDVPLRPVAKAIGIYRPKEDEPMVSLIVPAFVASHLSVSIELQRKESEEILATVSAVCFIENSRNRLPFHGNVTERALYRVTFTNITEMHVQFIPAILVHQP